MKAALIHAIMTASAPLFQWTTRAHAPVFDGRLRVPVVVFKILFVWSVWSRKQLTKHKFCVIGVLVELILIPTLSFNASKLPKVNDVIKVIKGGVTMRVEPPHHVYCL